MEPLAYLIKRVKDEAAKGRNLVFDIWVDAHKTHVKEVFSPEDLEFWVDDQQADAEIRIRMYYTYGSNNTSRHIEEFLIKDVGRTDNHITSTSSVPAIPHAVPTMGTVTPSAENPLTWILNERTERLNEIKSKYEKAKDKIEEYRDTIVKLERDILQKDNTISNLTSQNEQGKGLNGFLSNNPGVAEKIVEVAGPSLMQLLSQQIGQPKELNQGQVAQDVSEWIGQLDADSQNVFRSIVVAIATRHQANPAYLNRLNELLNKNQNEDESPLTKVS